MTQPAENTTEPDAWDAYQARYGWWPEQEISAPGVIPVCPLCGALVADWTGKDKHTNYHRSRSEVPIF